MQGSLTVGAGKACLGIAGGKSEHGASQLEKKFKMSNEFYA